MSAAADPVSETPRLPPGRTSLADGLPPHIAARISPEWRANEAGYWAAREELMGEFAGRWVAFAGGEVVAAGGRHVEVSHRGHAAHPRAFVTRVGFEDVPARIRRVEFPYDPSYGDEPMPYVTVVASAGPGRVAVTLDRVIPDTGPTTPSCRGTTARVSASRSTRPRRPA